MIQKSLHHDPQPWGMLTISLTLHLAAIIACNSAALFRPVLREVPTYYVDIVSLPAAEPAPAPPEPQAAAAPVPPAPARATLPARPAMTLPAKTGAPSSQPEPTTADDRDQEARDFAQRMNRLEYKAEARHQLAALAAVEKRLSERKSGARAVSGSGSTVDYGAYIQSRLKDALAETLIYRSKSPEAAVHLYIDGKGKLVRYVVERPSADKLFNDSVIRTIEKAKANFPPPPTAAGFDKLYVFSPQEITK